MDLMKELKKTDKKPVPEICALLFKAQTDAKLTHLAQPDKTLALHEAMNKFYEEIGDKIDTLVETYSGLYECEIIVNGSSKISNPSLYFNTLYRSIDGLRVPIKETFIQNQIDEVQQLIAHTLYRLKNIIT